MSILFTPCSLGPVTVENRITALPFFTAYAEENGTVGEQILQHYTRIASSGVGLVVVEATQIEQDNIPPYTLCAFDQSHLPGLTKLASSIKAQGAKAFLQICHTGRFAGFAGCLAPSAIPAFGDASVMPKEMTEEDIQKATLDFAASAKIVRDAGFDGVELHGATGYLLSSFTSPRTNKRSDGYGGTVEKRARFPLEVAQAVREAVGDFPIGWRFMVREYLPEGMPMEEGLAFARMLVETLKPAYLSVTAGTHECFAHLASSKNNSPEGFMREEALAVKKTVPDTAVIAAGQLVSKEICEQTLEEGFADSAGLGRVLFADFKWPAKVKGIKHDEIRACIQCNTCQRQISKGKPAFCSLWSKEEKEKYLSAIPAGHR